MEDFLYEFAHVRRIVHSCKTQDQYNNAHEWAKRWSKRMIKIYPNVAENWETLFDQVISE
jgi:hypothetical protein